MITIARRATLGLLAVVCLIGSPIGCGDDGGGTTGRRVALEVRIASPSAVTAFASSSGWTVELTKAELSTGAMYFFDGAPLLSGVVPGPSPARRLFGVRATDVRGLFGVRAAHAHPGHYVRGEARGELLAPTSVDLRTSTSLGVGTGVTGMTRSATFSFHAPATGPFAASLGGSVVLLEGTATRGADARRFRAEIGAEDLGATAGRGSGGASAEPVSIEGCPFAEVDVQADGVVTVTVDVALWFDQVDFTDVAVAADDVPVTLGPDDVARRALVRGMKAAAAYDFTYAPR